MPIMNIQATAFEACEGGSAMVTLEMNDEESKLLLNVLERYHSHLEVEVKRTDRREFREALKEREANLKELIVRVRSLVKE